MCTERASARETLWDWPDNDDARDAQFVEMLRAFRRSGGLAREAEIIQQQQTCRSSGRRGEDRPGPVICFEWGQRFWLPWFQFNRADMSLRPGPAKVLAELTPVFDGWAIALWFAQPNLWIGEQRPIDLIDHCLVSVLGAARADRFIAAG